MKRTLAIATALMFASGAALASHCPKDMKAIDEALAKNPKLSEAQMKEVKDLRAQGEKEHKDGKHADSEKSLHKAMGILKIDHAK